MKRILSGWTALLTFGMLCVSPVSLHAQSGNKSKEPLLVRKCTDFSITGDGSNPAWGNANWNMLNKLDSNGKDYPTKFRIMYSSTGIYLFFTGEDGLVTTKYDKDFDDLFNADVFEVFFHPDTNTPLYLEYEVNPLDKELVLLIPHLKNRIFGWIPWHYEKDRLIKKMVHVDGGDMKNGAKIRSWSAELYFPYGIFKPLNNVPPTSGTEWNANFYRLDYDSGKQAKWAWTPVNVSFHEFEKFQAIRFE
jgi:hypothetical protein